MKTGNKDEHKFISNDFEGGYRQGLDCALDIIDNNDDIRNKIVMELNKIPRCKR